MAKFKVNYVNYVNSSTPSGSDDIPDFGYIKKVNNDSGLEEIVFEQIGSHSQSEYINSFADSVDLKKLMERYQHGDITVLSKRIGDYIDSVGVPDNLLDAKLMIQNGEKAFADLPSDIKDKFANDPMKFIQACQDGSIKDVIKGLDEQQKIDQEIKNVSYKIQDQQAQQIKDLQAQIAELKGVKYE